MMPTSPRRSDARNGAGGSGAVLACVMVSADMAKLASEKLILTPTRMIRKAISWLLAGLSVCAPFRPAHG
jgi:hypothetical protein